MKRILFFVLITVIVAACSKEEHMSDDPDDPVAIAFSSSLNIAVSRAPLTGKTLPDGGELLVYAYRHNKDVENDFSRVYINGESLNDYSGESNSLFAADKVYYWPIGDRLDFYACFYKGNGVGVKIADQITYQLQDSIDKQVDLLYALPVKDCYKSEVPALPVPLVFDHAMSLVKFKFKSTTHPGAKLQSVSFDTPLEQTFSLRDTAFIIGTPEPFTIKGNVVAPSGADVSEDAISTMIFPGTWEAGKKITVMIDGNILTPYELTRICKMESGKIYTYNIEYQGSVVSFSTPVVKEWEQGVTDEDIVFD